LIRCDVVVVGAGAVGSATAWWLARSGVDVVLLEQFEAGHARGSSHGSTRIFRIAYPEPTYIDMARSALPLWRELEDDAGTELLVTTGGIDYGEAESVKKIVDALVHEHARHEVLDAPRAAERWPGFTFDGPVLFQPEAGRILADRTVRALHERARAHGASVHFQERVLSLTPDAEEGIVASTQVGEYRAATAVVTAGAWLPDLLKGLVGLPPLTVTREQVFHFAPRVQAEWPCFIHHGRAFTYGLEAPEGEGVKVAEHHTGAITTADERSFEIDEAGRRRIIGHVAAHMPGLEPTPTSATTCLYTNTPDESFILERHGPVVVGSACSGHGFKFVPLIGLRLAELAIGKGLLRSES
jgi:sarcosine oxidase